MWFSIEILQIAVLVLVAGMPHDELQCMNHRCHHEEACRLTNVANVTQGHCIPVHGPGAPHHIVYGCPQTLNVGEYCICRDDLCIQSVTHGQVTLAGGDVQCGHHRCHHDQVCRHSIHHEGDLHSDCIPEHEMHHAMFGCSTLPSERHPCYCDTAACNSDLYNKYYHNIVQGANNNVFQCGDHMCHGKQVCIFEGDKHHHHLELWCEDHIPRHLRHRHCLPDLLSHHDQCYCDSGTCVDQAVISIINGLHVSGLICEGHDLLHVCRARQVCEIRHEFNGVYTRHCADGRHTMECQHAPIVGQICHCSTQKCVFGNFTDMLTTTPMPVTTASPTTMAVVTTQAPQQTTTAAVMVTSQAPQQTTAAAGMVTTQAPQPTTAAATQAPATGGMGNTTVGMNTNMPVVTAAHVSTHAPTTVAACTDVEDGLFSCAVYDMMYKMCAASTGTLHTVANKRCRKFCGICSGSGGMTNTTVAAATAGQPVCVDHDARCFQFQSQICSANVSQHYVIATCPLTCNKCPEYFASLQAPLPSPSSSDKCFTCGDLDNLIPCYSKEVFDNNTNNAASCPFSNSYCMTDMYQDIHGNTDIFKRCVTEQVCNSKWINESAGLNYCSKYGSVTHSGEFECHFCCKGAGCNTGIKPPTLVAKP